MEDHSFLIDILVFLIAAVIVVPIFQRLRSSMIVGYLVAGLIIGPHGLALVSNQSVTSALAELGVIFLLFTLGLELTVDRLRVVRGFIFGLGTAQVVITASVIAVIAGVFFLDTNAAIIVGGALALSSTAVVMQSLSERGETMTRVGRVAISILLLQDLAVVPLFAIIPALSSGGEGAVAIAVLFALAKAAIAIVAIFAFGRLVLRPAFRAIAVGRSPELFAGITLLVLLGASFTTASLGLSLAMGGFIAGMLLGETEYRMQVAAEIAPFRGLLLGVFFMTVGLDIDVPLIIGNAGLILVLVLALLLAKGMLVTLLVRLSRQRWPVAIHTGLLLSQGGEFAFIILGLAARDSLIDAETANLLIGVVVMTMALTPALAWLGSRIENRNPPPTGNAIGPGAVKDASHLQDHVIVAGFGRVGQSVSKMLAAAEIPYVAIEFEPTRVADARARGLPVYFGDASRPEILDALGADRARAAVVILDNADAAERTVHLLRRRHPKIDIFVRAKDHRHQQKLEEAGANAVIPETFEMSLQLGASVLRRFGTANESVQDIVDDLRFEDYAALNDIIYPKEDSLSGGKKKDRKG